MQDTLSPIILRSRNRLKINSYYKLPFYNQYGQLVKQLEIETIPVSPIEVSLDEFTNGTYHVFIQLDGDRKPISKKLQVTKLY